MALTASHRRVGDDIVAAYLVVIPVGATVSDAGIAGHWRELLTEFTSVGLALDDVKA